MKQRKKWKSASNKIRGNSYVTKYIQFSLINSVMNVYDDEEYKAFKDS